LVKALRSGNSAAIAEVEDRYGRVLSGFLRQALPDPLSVDDIRQQVLVEVWRRGPEFDPQRASPLTWILMIARSRVIDEQRRRRPEPVDPSSAEEFSGTEAETSERLLERWRLAGLLEQIPRDEATTLRLRFYEELSQTEIAERTGMTLGTVKRRMVVGLSRLRELIEEEEGR
jgi:RNA polymerase sigma-70 factor (ECF subfamily)